MPRSRWKGPFLDYHLYKKMRKGGSSGSAKKSSFKKIRLWSRRSVILPQMVGHKVNLYNGKTFLPLVLSEEMIGHKLGEFVFTRQGPKHKKRK